MSTKSSQSIKPNGLETTAELVQYCRYWIKNGFKTVEEHVVEIQKRDHKLINFGKRTDTEFLYKESPPHGFYAQEHLRYPVWKSSITKLGVAKFHYFNKIRTTTKYKGKTLITYTDEIDISPVYFVGEALTVEQVRARLPEVADAMEKYNRPFLVFTSDSMEYPSDKSKVIDPSELNYSEISTVQYSGRD